MSSYIFFLGREPSLSIAELRSLFVVEKIRSEFAFIQAKEEDITRLREGIGGTIKIGKILFQNVSRNDIKKCIVENLRTKIIPGKKLRLGIDTFVAELRNVVFQIKDALKKDGHSIRVVQHENGRIKTATTLHEKLLQNGAEYMIIVDEKGYTIAETIWVQDIESYSKRDMERNRSMKVGMMPPKLAQIMINLATRGDRNMTIWDPFCGLGTTLIEGLHAGYTSLFGSDIDEKMVEATTYNMSQQEKESDTTHVKIFQLDARYVDTYSCGVDAVIITEGMLGRNFTPETLTRTSAQDEKEKLSILYNNFLASAHKNLFIRRMVFCLPFWNIPSGIVYMPKVEDMNKDWIIDDICCESGRYLQHIRIGQQVGREIVVVSRGNHQNTQTQKIK